jgi:ADP-heptose:LPS heptosyltransferase
MTVLLTGRGEESGLIGEFSRSYAGRSIDVSGFESVSEIAAILRRCDLVISNDSGIMHLGAAMGAPTVGLFGPSTPQQWAPRGPRASFVCARGIPCSPCMRVYRGPAPTACANPIQLQCLLAIDVDEVLQAVQRVTARWR